VFEVKGLKKDYDGGSVQALRGGRIYQGEFVAITGPSGCGKSTLLQMLGALDHPSAGILNYWGKSLPDIGSPSAYRALEIGIIFQAFHLLPTFTALENVQLPMFESDRPASSRRDHAVGLLKSGGWNIASTIFPTSSPAVKGSVLPSPAA
jgi:ABC-type lipoprotein export system ATPase subunit